MLEKIEVKGFKSIKGMGIELKSLNILIGANGVGKSNFVSLFKLINKIIEKNLQVFVAQSGGVDTLLYFGQKQTKELFVDLFFGQNSYHFSLVPTLKNTLIFSREKGCYLGGGYNTPYIAFKHNGNNETNMYDDQQSGKVAKYILDTIKSWKLYHFHDTSDSSKMKQFGNINDNIILQPDASNLAAYLFYLKQKYPQDYRNIVETIQTVAPFFDDFILRHNPINDNLIQLEWKEKGSDVLFNSHSFSDGTLRFICLTTLLLQPDLPSIILLDEPELGLHPYAITLLSSLIKSAATKTQIIIATQSVTFVNQFDPGDIIVVDRDADQSTFKRLNNKDMENWLEEYGLGDLWEKNILGGRP